MMPSYENVPLTCDLKYKYNTPVNPTVCHSSSSLVNKQSNLSPKEYFWSR